MPRNPSLKKVQEWDEDAQPGCILIYHHSDGQTLLDTPTDAFRYLRQAADDGLTILTQLRISTGALAYRATRISPRTRRYLNSISPPVSRASDRQDV